MGRTVAIVVLSVALVGVAGFAHVALEAERSYSQSMSEEWRKADKRYGDVCYYDIVNQSQEWRARCVLAAGHKMSNGEPWFCFSRETFAAMGSLVGASCVGP